MTPSGNTALSLPELPSGIKVADVLGTETLDARVILSRDMDKQTQLVRRGATSKTFQMKPSF